MRWMGIVMLCGVLGVVGWALSREFAPAPKSSAPPEAGASGDVSRQPLIFAGGIVEGAGREIVVMPEIAGRLKSIDVNEGDTVRKGDLLATIESDLWEIKLQEARARLAIAMAERHRLASPQNAPASASSQSTVKFGAVARDEGSEAEAVRLNASREQPPRGGAKGAAGVRQVSSPQSSPKVTETPPVQKTIDVDDMAIADARVTLAQAAVTEGLLMVGKTRVRSPIDGVVVRIEGRAGEMAQPASLEGLFAVADRTRMHVRVFVEELDAMNVCVGQSALVAAVGRPSQRYLGTVVFCAPSMRPKTHRHLKPGERIDVQVREAVIELEDGFDLLIGLPVEVHVQRDEPRLSRSSGHLMSEQDAKPSKSFDGDGADASNEPSYVDR